MCLVVSLEGSVALHLESIEYKDLGVAYHLLDLQLLAEGTGAHELQTRVSLSRPEMCIAPELL